MTTPLRALLVEDFEDDALLVVLELRHGGFDVTFERVDTPGAMAARLRAETWDIVISDFSMPGFDALAALAVLQQADVDVPAIVVSGTIGEETAVKALQAGARDFIVKGQLARLVPAVQRELREAAARKAKRATERALQASELRYRRLLESGIVGVIIGDDSGRLLEANEAFLRMTGYSRSDLESGAIEWTRLTPAE